MPSIAFFFLLLAPAAAQDELPRNESSYPLAGTQWAQLSIERRIIIRVPALVNRRAGPSPQPPVVWVEKRTDRCLPMKSIVGAAIMEENSVDLILGNQSRVRAILDEGCRSADFYLGFYMEPTSDERLCADRDVIHARSGAMCEIDEFKRLAVKK